MACNRNRNRTLISVLFLLALSSCKGLIFKFEPYEYKIVPKEDVAIVDNGVYFKPNSFTKSYEDVFRSHPLKARRRINLDVKGDVNLLVLPIEFSDYKADLLDGNNGEDAHKIIQNAFFGKEEVTQWHSVASFYDASSYGKLKIHGEVAPWYELGEDYSIAKINDPANIGRDKQTITKEILRRAVAHYKRENPEKISNFDLNEDNVIDAVYLIYTHPIKINRDETSSLFWAYSAFDNIDSHNVELEGPPPYANAYSWSSYEFMRVNNSLFKNKPDAHAYIHETGHLLGLPDYYNTNLNSKDNPLGGFDIMDYTVGDHTGLSKMFLDWAYPKVITGPGVITLRPFTKTGDLALVTNNWNGSAVDEYLLLEFYAPIGLNRLDSFINTTFNLPSDFGLKVYHVDARTIFVDQSSMPYTFYYSNGQEKPENMIEELAHSNSDAGPFKGKFTGIPLYKLLEASGENTFVNGEKATNETLFKNGLVFGRDVFADFSFNSKGDLPFNFEVVKITKDNITIRFTSH
ncbi:MAG: hypothetical protein QM205_03970 [Bacillota bacterium]|jgi:M6 family metalloprotease-like protein|nr:hypothetical protein [Bacillota bacterium]